MEKTYYKASLSDIVCGAEIETNIVGGGWRSWFVTEHDFHLSPVGQNNIHTLIHNIQNLNSGTIPNIRVRHVHTDDIESLGFKEDMNVVHNNGIKEFTRDNFRIVFHTDTREMQITEEEKRNDGVEIVTIFDGTPLNKYELILVLKMIGAYPDTQRVLNHKMYFKDGE